VTRKLTRVEIRLAAAFLAADGDWRFTTSTARAIRIPGWRLYGPLDQWEQDNWIQAQWFEQGRDRPRRRGYRLTDKGKAALAKALA